MTGGKEEPTNDACCKNTVLGRVTAESEGGMVSAAVSRTRARAASAAAVDVDGAREPWTRLYQTPALEIYSFIRLIYLSRRTSRSRGRRYQTRLPGQYQPAPQKKVMIYTTAQNPDAGDPTPPSQHYHYLHLPLCSMPLS